MPETQNSTESFVFDLRLAEEQVTMTNKDGNPQTYYLTELSGQALEEYLDENRERVITEVKDDKVIIKGVRSYKNMYVSLLKRALRDSSHKLIPVVSICEFPHRVQEQLFKRAQVLSGIKKDDDAKKDDDSGN